MPAAGGSADVTLGVMTTARDALLLRARELMIAGVWPQTPLADVAASAGVSRQTLYNEFRSRDGLAEAVAQQAAEVFRVGTLSAAQEQSDPVSAVTAAMSWAIETAATDPLIKAGLTDDAADLLPFLTYRSRQILLPVSTGIAAHLDRPGGEWACEVALRLTVSHLLLPLVPDDNFVAAVGELIRPLLNGAGVPQ
jgi:AcrR family transcriptional regulator